MGPEFIACPYSDVPDEHGEGHPHNAGYYTVDGVRTCAVCLKPLPYNVADWPAITVGARNHAETRAELARITGIRYWERPPPKPEDQEGGK